MWKRLILLFFLPVIHASFVTLCMHSCTVSASKQEGDALKSFIASVDPEGKVAKQWSTEDPCGDGVPWRGVNCSGARSLNVTSLVLDNMDLTGSIPEGTLGMLTELRILSLTGNGLTGRIPTDLINCAQLKHLYLSDNVLSGPIPSPLSYRLKRIYLDNNQLSGQIPASITNINGLLSLFLQNNMLEGSIPHLDQQSLVEFNVSGNKLSGQIPSALALKGFSTSVFMGNSDLCGAPFQACIATPGLEESTGGTINDQASNQKQTKRKLTTGTIIGIVVACIAILLFMAFCVVYRYKSREVKKGTNMKVVPNSDSEDFLSGTSIVSLTTDEDKPRLVFFDETHTFQLEDLLRASAELLGKGSLGSAYKAVMEDGRGMCVKRLKELNHVGRRDFEQQMQLVGKLRHPNVVPLWAYYYAKEEKLLVYEYQPNGSLLNLLRSGQQWKGDNGGRRAATAKPLPWNARLRIAKGIAKGLAYLCESLNIPHGNIKASNILIDKDYEARIADFGLATLLMGPSILCKPATMMAYQAPECKDSKQRVTQKADVYSFGVLLLELLTGRVTEDNGDDDDSSYASPRDAFNLPEWVTAVVKEEWSAEVFDRTLFVSNSSEESLITMLQIAMGCTSKSADQRPHMGQVHKMIADIHEDDNNVSSTSLSLDQAQFEFISSDYSTVTSTRTPFYEDRDTSFEF